MNTSLPSHHSILDALTAIEDPDFHKNIVELNFVQNLIISEVGEVSFDLVLTTPACPVKDKFVAESKQIVGALPGVTAVNVTLKAQPPKNPNFAKDSLLGNVQNIIAVSSGKGGVGKSTVTANLAMALALSGARVGILDADIYGPSMVMMFGVNESPEVREDSTLVPVSVSGIQIVSMAMFSDPNKATIWRGPMVTQMIQNFLHRVHWGNLDYLLIDFPPGTGDIQLTLTQNCPISGAVVVTTPQEVALADVRKGLAMFRSVAVPVLGVVENMSYFICDNCDKKHHIFSQGGGLRTARELKLEFLGEIPLEPFVTESGDKGRPVVYTHPNSASGKAFLDLAGRVASRLAVFSASAGELGGFHMDFQELPVIPMTPAMAKSSLPSTQEATTPTAQSLARTPEGQIALGWSDGSFSLYSARFLRLQCPCAACVDEWSGEKLVDQTSIPQDVTPASLYSVGRYAIGISFSDGHRGGIFTFEYLRTLSFASC